MRPAHEERVQPHHQERRGYRPDKALHQPFEDERRPDEAVGGADELHHLYLLAPGEDREPYGVEDEQDARRKEQGRRPPERPDSVARDLVQAIHGLLWVADLVVLETLRAELVGDRRRVS